MSNEKSPPTPQPPVDSGSQALAAALHSSFGIVKVVMVVLLVVFLFSGFFTVGPQEKAIKLRFGKPVGAGDNILLGSGPHWSWPYPIDEVVKIPIAEIQEVHSRTMWFMQTAVQEATGDTGYAGPSLNPAVDGAVLTGDGNILHAKATVRYRIDDPVRCVFGFSSDTNQTYSLAGISNAVLNVLDNALVYVSARSRLDDALLDKLTYQDAVQRRLTQLVQAENLGILVDQCTVELRQPRQLDAAFQRVTTARLNKSTALTQARSYRDKTLNAAEGESVSRLNAAQAERNEMVAKIRGDANRFTQALPGYLSDPDLFIHQHLTKSVNNFFAGADYKMYLPTTPDGKPLELRLNLNREPLKMGDTQPKP